MNDVERLGSQHREDARNLRDALVDLLMPEILMPRQPRRFLADRRRRDGVHIPGQRQPRRRRGPRHGRRPRDRRRLAVGQLVEPLLAVRRVDVDAPLALIGVAGALDGVGAQRTSDEAKRPVERGGRPHHEGLRLRPQLRERERLRYDLRPNSGRVAQRNADPRTLIHKRRPSSFPCARAAPAPSFPSPRTVALHSRDPYRHSRVGGNPFGAQAP